MLDIEIKYEIQDRYTAAEIVDILGLTTEEIIDILEVQIEDNIELFDLLVRGIYDEEEEKSFS
jgi:hypothetical protein